MTDIPSKEPRSFRAGDLVSWTRSFPDYPASGGYALNYYLSSQTASIILTASASADDYLISLSAATTTAYTAGIYRYQARISLSMSVITVGEGIIQIYAEMSGETAGLTITGANAQTPQQQLIFWRSVRANIYDLLAGKVLADNYSYSIAGRSLNKYNFDELTGFLNYTEKKIVGLERLLGVRRPSTVLVEFT